MNKRTVLFFGKVGWMFLFGLLFVMHAEAAVLTLSAGTATPGAVVPGGNSGTAPHELMESAFGNIEQGLAENSDRMALKVTKSMLLGVQRVAAMGGSIRLSAGKSLLIGSDWASLGFGSDHSGQNSDANALAVGNVGSLGAVLGGSSFLGESFMVFGGMIYAVSGFKFSALDAAVGASNWRHAKNGAGLISVAGGAVYADCGAAKNGALSWRYDAGNSASSSSHVVANGVVYSASCHTVYALNAATGALKWFYDTDDGIVGSPAVANGMVYVGSADKMQALDALTGARKWAYTSGGNPIKITPVVADGTVYIKFGNCLYALNAVTGFYKWRSATDAGETTLDWVSVAEGAILVSGLKGIVALDTADGSLKWRTDFPNMFGDTLEVLCGDAMADDMVYFRVAFWDYPSDEPGSRHGWESLYLPDRMRN